MGITDNPLERKRTLLQGIIEESQKYGIFALILLLFTIYNGFILWNAKNYVDRAEQQAAANEKIGILEGQIQMLLKK